MTPTELHCMFRTYITVLNIGLRVQANYKWDCFIPMNYLQYFLFNERVIKHDWFYEMFILKTFTLQQLKS